MDKGVRPECLAQLIEGTGSCIGSSSSKGLVRYAQRSRQRESQVGINSGIGHNESGASPGCHGTAGQWKPGRSSVGLQIDELRHLYQP
jgi:hypothetical protein